jgi:hypothetical protein
MLTKSGLKAVDIHGNYGNHKKHHPMGMFESPSDGAEDPTPTGCHKTPTFKSYFG